MSDSNRKRSRTKKETPSTSEEDNKRLKISGKGKAKMPPKQSSRKISPVPGASKKHDDHQGKTLDTCLDAFKDMITQIRSKLCSVDDAVSEMHQALNRVSSELDTYFYRPLPDSVGSSDDEDSSSGGESRAGPSEVKRRRLGSSDRSSDGSDRGRRKKPEKRRACRKAADTDESPHYSRRHAKK